MKSTSGTRTCTYVEHPTVHGAARIARLNNRGVKHPVTCETVTEALEVAADADGLIAVPVAAKPARVQTRRDVVTLPIENSKVDLFPVGVKFRRGRTGYDIPDFLLSDTPGEIVWSATVTKVLPQLATKVKRSKRKVSTGYTVDPYWKIVWTHGGGHQWQLEHRARPTAEHDSFDDALAAMTGHASAMSAQGVVVSGEVIPCERLVSTGSFRLPAAKIESGRDHTMVTFYVVTGVYKERPGKIGGWVFGRPTDTENGS